MMRKLPGLFLLLTMCLLTLYSQAQNLIVKGTVKASGTKENIPAVSVNIKGTSIGTYTDENGNFSLSVSKFPIVLLISSVGYENAEVAVSGPQDALEITLKVSSGLGQEIVVSATRVATRILESPVSIERVSTTAIRNAPSASYYDVVANLKGVDMLTSSLTFKTPTTRGFSGSGNLRFNQLVDGMDNQAPGLNFAVGSMVGLSELDVDNMELLPGASSALYGPGGMNGTLLISSKSPFKYQGLSVQIKQGVLHTDQKYRPEASPYYNWSVRWAQKLGTKAAFKLTSEFIQAKDWVGADERNYLRTGTTGLIVPGTRSTDPNYDGVNVYGDETTLDLRQILGGIAAQAPFLAPFIGTLSAQPINVSRTGYKEIDLIDPYTVNFKLGGAFHYKINRTTEAMVMANWGTGNTVYTGSDRYSFRGLNMGQYKVEINSKNWFLRGWTTQENAGQSYNTTVTTRLVNEQIRPTITFTNGQPTPKTTDWAVVYAQNYLGGMLSGLKNIDAHNLARTAADQGAPAVNSAQFKKIFNDVRRVPISQGGGLLIDQTNLYAIDGQYNLSHITGPFADVLIGGNYRRFVLNSQGTVFADSAGTIGINEYGAYVQATKKLLNDNLILTVSGRYDKNQNFKGRFTPRATALYKVSKNSNIRLSYQTAYRFPSTQQQWINLVVAGGVRLLGGVQDLKDYYKFGSNPVYSLTSVLGGAPAKASFDDFKPESVSSYEIGYKGLHANGKLLVDIYGYYGQYQNFIVRTLVVQSATGNPADLANSNTRSIYSVPVNSKQKVSTYGFGFSLDYKLPKNFFVAVNASSDVLGDVEPGFITFFNAPKYRANVQAGNSGFGPSNSFSFAVVYRWQEQFLYESDFITGTVNQVQIVDAQVSYKLPKTKSLFKLGANNLLNQYYVQGVGNPSIGGLYYVSYGYNL